MRPGRRVIVSEAENFPTDLYMAEGLADLLEQGHRLKLVGAGELAAALDDEVAVLMLTHVWFGPSLVPVDAAGPLASTGPSSRHATPG